MKIRFTVLIIALAMIFASCSAAPPPAEEDKAVAAFNERDLVLVIDGADYPLCTDAEPLLAALGGGYETTAAESCVYEGEDKEFAYDDITVYTNPIGGKDVFYLVEIYGGDYATSKGIKIGSALNDVKAAYGSGGFEKDGAYIYFLSGNKDDIKSRQLVFDLDDQGKVTMISYYDPSTNLR